MNVILFKQRNEVNLFMKYLFYQMTISEKH